MALVRRLQKRPSCAPAQTQSIFAPSSPIRDSTPLDPGGRPSDARRSCGTSTPAARLRSCCARTRANPRRTRVDCVSTRPGPSHTPRKPRPMRARLAAIPTGRIRSRRRVRGRMVHRSGSSRIRSNAIGFRSDLRSVCAGACKGERVSGNGVPEPLIDPWETCEKKEAPRSLRVGRSRANGHASHRRFRSVPGRAWEEGSASRMLGGVGPPVSMAPAHGATRVHM